MDRILRPEKLDTDPHGAKSALEFKHWLATFENFISAADVKAEKRLQVLVNYVSPTIYALIADSSEYTEAIAALKNIFIKPKNIVFARHCLATRRQQPGESVDQFLQALRQLGKDCDFKTVTADVNRNDCIRDAFINGLDKEGLDNSIIRQRLLEFTTLTLEEAMDKARALEAAKHHSDEYKQTNIEINNTTQKLPNEEIFQCSVASRTISKCYFCGRSRHPRSDCPAREATCDACGKIGHWSLVCRSQAKTTFRSTRQRDKTSASLITSIVATASGRLRKSTIKVKLNGIAADALVDTGSTETFINKRFAQSANFRLLPSKENIKMANTSLCSSTSGHCFVTLELLGHTHLNTKLSILPDLCTDVILGHDVLGRHSKVEVDFGGPEPTLKICCVAQADVEPPALFSNLSSDCRPIATKYRKHSSEDEAFIQNEIEKLIQDGVIEESKSSWRAQVIVVENERRKKRMVVDYSQTINRFTFLDAYPSPNIEDVVSKVSRSRIFSTIDLRSAYHQIPILEKERQYTAFQAAGKLYHFLRIPFGVTNGVAAFQRVMDGIIKREKLKGVYAYLDDVTICGQDQTEHDASLAAFMVAVQKYGLTLNDEKCKFSQPSITLLGYLIENGTLKPDPSRIEPLLQLPLPTDCSSLKRAVGMFAHYSKWISRFSEKVHSLVTCKIFPVTPAVSLDFEKLKEELARSALSAIDLNIPFVVETDASNVAIAATLSQSGKPVAFFSKTLSKSVQCSHSSVEKEAYAIVESIKKWRHFLMGRHFKLITDQRSVSFMFDTKLSSKIKNDKILRWRLELSCYSYDIIYRPGIENTVADAFSRVCGATTNAKSLLELHQALCHPGVTRMLHWVRNRNLPYSIQEIREMTSSCSMCAEVKPRYGKTEMGKLIKATSPFERLNIDFKGPLPSSTRNHYMLTVVDEYSRFPFAIPCPDMTAATVAKALDKIFSVFGTPAYIHSDQGTSFMSEELKTFFRSLAIASSRSTPYNPEGNGQTERYNGIIWRAITLALKTKQLKTCQWEQVLDTALHSIRSLLCTTTNCTPHERMFQHHRRTPTGTSIPSWLVPGPILLKRHVRQSKYDPLVDEVELLEVNPEYAHIRHENGKEATVSLRHLAPRGSTHEISDERTEIADPKTTQTADPEASEKDELSSVDNNQQTASDGDLPTQRPARLRLPPKYLEAYET